MNWPDALHGPAVTSPSPLLWLRVGVFDPLDERIPLSMDLDGRSSKGVYLVQFKGPLSPDTGVRLASVDARVMGYVPDDGLVVKFARPSTVLAVSLWKDVRWLCPWQDGWKISPALEGARGQIDLGVITWGGSDDIDRDIRSLGGRVLNHQLDLYVVRIDGRAAPQLTGIPGVSWVEPWTTPIYLMDNAARSTGARQNRDGAFDPEGMAIWAYNNDTDTFSGITGRTVTVDITDSGVDGTHAAFDGRKDKYTSLIDTQTPWSDPRGHGTHVAGIVLGDGSYRDEEDQFYHDNLDGTFVGMAPGAHMLAQSLWGENETFTYRNLTKWSVRNGAQISQNSWAGGAWGNYSIVSRDYDNTTRDADWTTDGDQSLLVVFAAGNDGIFGNNTLSSPAVGKNVIAVGATGNGKNVTGEDEVWLHSSKGWTDDGRIKPDLVAPGDDVTSTWGIDDNGATGALPAEAGDHSYITYTGTSMSAPVVSGSAALVMDYLISKQGQTEPSPAVVKSILIASADHLDTSAWPGREQGWGRVNASRAIVETRDNNMEFIDQTTTFDNIGQSQSYRYDVQAGNPLRIALVWTDLPSDVLVGKVLINDLDLEVESPSGKVYKGNVFGGGQSITGGTSDDTNNVEMVYLDAPEAGEWEVTVSCSNLPPLSNGGSQDYAVAVVGNVNKKFVDLAAQNLSVRAVDAAEGDTIPIVFDLANLGNLPAPTVGWVVNILDENGVLHELLDQGYEEIDPRSDVRIYLNWTAVRGEFTVRVVPNPLRTIREESYQNNNASKTFFVKGFGVSGEVEIPALDGLPGTDVEFVLDVTNEGNVPDRFIMTRSEPPGGWNARLDVAYLDINPGATKNATLVVTVPSSLTAGMEAKVNVTIESQGNSSHTIELMTVTTVSSVHSLTLTMQPLSLHAAPGETATFPFTLTNDGNSNDTFKVTYWQQSGPDDGVEFTLNRSSFAVGMGDVVEGEISVHLDEAFVGDLPADEKITFVLKADSVKSGYTISRSLTASVVIQQMKSITITPPFQDEFPVMPGEEASFTFDLTNTGNGEDMVTPTALVPDGWTWRTGEPSILLTSGETKTVQMWVTVSTTATAGDQEISVVAKVGDETLSSTPLNFVVDWFPRLTVTASGGYDGNLTQGEEVSVEFRVTNSGNGPDSVTVEISGLSRGITAESRPASKDLAQDEIGTFIIVLTASDDAELLEGHYRITFVYAEGVERHQVQVNITVEQKTNGPGPQDPDDDDDDDGGIPFMLIGIIIAVIVIIVVGYFAFMSAQRRRDETVMQEEFFKDTRKKETTSAVLEEEMASRRETPSPPPSPESEWVDPGSDEPAVHDEVPTPVAAPASPGSCPECGNAMQPMGPDGGRYCPMCGHQEGGP